MKKLLLALGLATVLFTSCNKEDLPTPGDRCGSGQVTEKGLEIDEENTFLVDGERVTHTTYNYYIWIIDECTGETLREELYDWQYNAIEKGDYYTK